MKRAINALVAGAASRAISGRRSGRLLAGGAALAGYILLALGVSGPRLVTMAPRLLFATLLFAAISALAAGLAGAPGAADSTIASPALRGAPRRLSRPQDRIPWWGAAGGVAVLVALELLLAIEALSIDVFHHGEVLASAVASSPALASARG